MSSEAVVGVVTPTGEQTCQSLAELSSLSFGPELKQGKEKEKDKDKVYMYPKIPTGSGSAQMEKDLLIQTVYLLEKVDGSNGCIFFENKDQKWKVACNGRVRTSDDSLFYKLVNLLEDNDFVHGLDKNFIYCGEVLMRGRHQKLSYERTPRNYFVMFDAVDQTTGKFVPHEKVIELCSKSNFELIKEFMRLVRVPATSPPSPFASSSPSLPPTIASTLPISLQSTSLPTLSAPVFVSTSTSSLSSLSSSSTSMLDKWKDIYTNIVYNSIDDARRWLMTEINEHRITSQLGGYVEGFVMRPLRLKYVSRPFREVRGMKKDQSVMSRTGYTSLQDLIHTQIFYHFVTSARFDKGLAHVKNEVKQSHILHDNDGCETPADGRGYVWYPLDLLRDEIENDLRIECRGLMIKYMRYELMHYVELENWVKEERFESKSADLGAERCDPSTTLSRLRDVKAAESSPVLSDTQAKPMKKKAQELYPYYDLLIQDPYWPLIRQVNPTDTDDVWWSALGLPLVHEITNQIIDQHVDCSAIGKTSRATTTGSSSFIPSVSSSSPCILSVIKKEDRSFVKIYL